MALVGSERALLAPLAFVAVTLTRSRERRSLDLTRYVEPVALAMVLQARPELLQRSQPYEKLVGEPAQRPFRAVRTLPTRFVPTIFGRSSLSGGMRPSASIAPAASTRPYRTELPMETAAVLSAWTKVSFMSSGSSVCARPAMPETIGVADEVPQKFTYPPPASGA